MDTYIIERNVGANAKRNREIIKERLIDGTTYEKLAEKFDLSVRQVKYIVKKCQSILFSNIK